MNAPEEEQRGIFSAISKVFGGGKKPSPKKKPKAASTGFNQFKYAPGAGCGTGAGGFKAGNNCAQGMGFNTPQQPTAFSKKGDVAASMPVKAAEVQAYAQHMKSVVAKKQAIVNAQAAATAKKAAQKAAQKAVAQSVVKKSYQGVLAKKQLIAQKAAKAQAEAQAAAEEAAKRAEAKAAAARAADKARKKAAQEAAEKAAKEATEKAAAEKAAARAAEKAQKEAEAQAEKLARAAKKAEEQAAAQKAAQNKILNDALVNKKSEVAFLPGDKSFDGMELNGVKFEPPSDPEFWKTAGDSGRFKEPLFDAKHSTPGFDTVKKSFGCIVVEPDGRVWLIEPKGHFGGYEHTFPKGGKDSGESNQQAAMREVFEESGLQVKIQAHLGDYEKSTGVTRYYIAKRVGGTPSLMGKESGSVKLVPFDKAKSLLNTDIDKKILDDAQKAIRPPSAKKAPTDAATVPAPPATPKPKIPQPSEVKVTKALGGSTGAKLGIGPDGKKYVLKQGNSSGHLQSEALADDLYEAAGVKVANKAVGKDAAGVDTKVAEFISGKTLGDLKVSNPKAYDAAVKQLRKDFVADALLGNWDVVGASMDNVIVSGGKVFRIDNGGALFYRAQGVMKDSSQFGGVVDELATMRDASKNPSAAAVFGGLTDKEISAQITKVLKKKEAILNAAASNQEVQATLKKRFDSLSKWQADYKKGLKTANKAKKPGAAAQASAAQKSPYSIGNEKSSSDLPKHSKSVNAAKNPIAALNSTFFKHYGKAEAAGSEWGSAAAKAALSKGVTTSALSWIDRKWIGGQLVGTLPSKAVSAFSSWSGSSKNINNHPNSSIWSDFKDGLKKLPLFSSGPIFRGMKSIDASTAKKWIETGEWTTQPYAKDGTRQYGFQSFATDSKVSLEGGFAHGDRAVFVVLKNPKTARDGVGIIGYDEHEVIATDEARHRVDSHYWVYKGINSGDLKTGQAVTSAQYNEHRVKSKVTPHSSFEHFHNDPNLMLVLEVSEK